MKKTICFISGSIAEAEFLFLIGEKFKELYNLDFIIMFTRKFLFDYFKKSKDNIFYFDWKVDTVSESDVKEYMQKYREHNLSLAIYSDAILRRKKLDYSIKVVIKHLRILEEFVDKYNIKAFIHYPTASVLGRSSYYCSMLRDLKHLIVQTGPVINETFSICDVDENWLWKGFLDSYVDGNVELNQDRRDEIDGIVKKIIEVKNRSIKIRKIKLKNIIALLLNSIKYKKYDAIERNEFFKLAIPFIRKFPLLFFKYDKKVDKEKYIFFPIHISWDAQIATRNPMYANQEYLVEILSRSLPYGYYLYVKEHPYNYGGEKKALLKRIKKYKNVKLIHPETSSLELIKDSQAVVTINSTAGIETILLKKPLISFGRTFYSHFKYTEKVDYINSLPSMIQRILLSNSDELVKSEDYNNEWYKFFWALYSSSAKGAANSYKNYMGLGKNIRDSNIEIITKSLFDKTDL